MSFSGIVITLAIVLFIIVAVLGFMLWVVLTNEKPSIVKDKLLGDNVDNYKEYFYRTSKDKK